VATQTSEKTPAERLLDALGPIDHFHEDVGDFGSPARMTMEEYLEPFAKADESSRLGPIEKVHLFWFAGMSCDGCSVAVTGATNPSVESLMLGAVGWVSGLVNAFPEENRLLWDRAKAGRWSEARDVYRWYMPLLHLDTHPKLVQYIKLAMAECGLGSETTRAPPLNVQPGAPDSNEPPGTSL